MVTVTITIVVVALVVAAGSGLLLYSHCRRNDHLVVRICQLFEFEPRTAREDNATADVRRSLVNALRQRRTDFDFDQFKQELEVGPDVARQVAERVYGDYYALSLADGIIGRREAVTLDALADLLHLGAESRRKIEMNTRNAGSGSSQP